MSTALADRNERRGTLRRFAAMLILASVATVAFLMPPTMHSFLAFVASVTVLGILATLEVHEWLEERRDRRIGAVMSRMRGES